MSIHPYFKQFGFDTFRITLIKAYDVCDRRHLNMYETLWMNKLSCINHNLAFNPIPRAVYDKQYRSKHKEAHRQHNRTYYKKLKLRIASGDPISTNMEIQKKYRMKLHSRAFIA